MGRCLGVELIPGRPGSKTRSMTSVRKEKAKRAMEYHQYMHEEDVLPRFIRLIDTLFTESTVFDVSEEKVF